jgi:hypothetical protein
MPWPDGDTNGNLIGKALIAAAQTLDPPAAPLQPCRPAATPGSGRLALHVKAFQGNPDSGLTLDDAIEDDQSKEPALQRNRPRQW